MKIQMIGLKPQDRRWLEALVKKGKATTADKEHAAGMNGVKASAVMRKCEFCSLLVDTHIVKPSGSGPQTQPRDLVRHIKKCHADELEGIRSRFPGQSKGSVSWKAYTDTLQGDDGGDDDDDDDDDDVQLAIGQSLADEQGASTGAGSSNTNNDDTDDD